MPSTLVSTNTQKPDLSRELALTMAQAADDRKGEDITILRVAEVSYLADYFVIVTGFSRAQVRAIAQAIEEKVEKEYLRQPLRVEGKGESNWILQDYGEIIVHILLPQEREFYNLEAFWGHAEQIEFQASQPQQ
ncbi:MAG: ribosome silencing factor [Cyanobacteriota bacterium]